MVYINKRGATKKERKKTEMHKMLLGHTMQWKTYERELYCERERKMENIFM